MDIKTPISLLQELLIKEACLPRYKLIYNGAETCVPLFKYEVTAKENISAIGIGKSKKEAKQNAAQSLLLKLKGENPLNENEPIVSPHSNIILQNAVGSLNEFCMKHKIILPEYIFREEGLPHAKMFIMSCSTLSYSTEGKSYNKKQAKQQAAQEMLSKLQKLYEDGNIDTSMEEKIIAKTSTAYDLTQEAYETVFKEREENKDKLLSNATGTYLCDYANYFLKNVLPFSVTLNALTDCNKTFLEQHQNPEDLLIAVMNQLNYIYNFSFLKTRSKVNFLCNLQIRELNNANFMCLGTSQDDAKQNAIIKALTFLTTMSRNI